MSINNGQLDKSNRASFWRNHTWKKKKKFGGIQQVETKQNGRKGEFGKLPKTLARPLVVMKMQFSEKPVTKCSEQLTKDQFGKR